MVPFSIIFFIFFCKFGKQLHPWSRFGQRCHLSGWSHFFLNMIIKEKRPHPSRWHRFPKRLQSGAVLVPLFLSAIGFPVWHSRSFCIDRVGRSMENKLTFGCCVILERKYIYDKEELVAHKSSRVEQIYLVVLYVTILSIQRS